MASKKRNMKTEKEEKGHARTQGKLGEFGTKQDKIEVQEKSETHENKNIEQEKSERTTKKAGKAKQ